MNLLDMKLHLMCRYNFSDKDISIKTIYEALKKEKKSIQKDYLEKNTRQ